MTDDIQKLKDLAEACPKGDPLRVMVSNGSWYIRNTAGIVLDVHRNRSFPQYAAENTAYANFIVAASPAVVLDLISQAKTLEILREYGCDGCGGQGHVHRADGEYMGVCTNCNAYELECVKRERDQLAEEVAQLKGVIADNLEPVSPNTAQKRERWLENIQDAKKFGLPRWLADRLTNMEAEIRKSMKYGGTRRLREQLQGVREALANLVRSSTGAQALDKLSAGQGVETIDGKAWLAASELAANETKKGGGE